MQLAAKSIHTRMGKRITQVVGVTHESSFGIFVDVDGWVDGMWMFGGRRMKGHDEERKGWVEKLRLARQP